MCKIKHLDHLNMEVADLAATATWYAEIFGFAEVERGVWNGRPWAILRAGDAMLCVYERPDLRLGDGLSHFALRITDGEAWERTVREHGLELGYGGVRRWPHSTAWYVSDPSGYEIEVVLWNDDEVRFGEAAT